MTRKLTGFEMLAKGPPPRPGYSVEADGAEIGQVTSGGQSPTLGKGIGMVYLPTAHAKTGSAIQIDVRGRKLEAQVVKKPFYSKS